MPDWATYRLSDFLLFSPRTYGRLFELYNAGVWPAHLAAVVGGLAIAAILVCRGRRAAPVVLAMLAACWLWIAWAFHLQRYATINWAATWFAAGFAVQGLLLIGAAGLGAGLQLRTVREPRGAIGFGLLGYALLVHPWVGVLLGRPWRQAEVFGLVPDPTTVATLGVMLLLQAAGERTTTAARIAVRLLWPLPVLWCLVGGATLWTMGSTEAPLLPLAASIAIGAVWWGARNHASAHRSD